MTKSALIKILLFLFGFGLLAAILQSADWPTVSVYLQRAGVLTVVFVLVLNILTFWTDVASWQLMFPSLPVTQLWMRRLYAIRMAGESFNYVLPAASIGGEPVKAMLLKEHYQISYRESTATLIIARTINSIALVVFLLAAIILVTRTTSFDAGFRQAAVIALVFVAAITAALYVIQRYRIGSTAGGWLFKGALAGKIRHLLDALVDAEHIMHDFFTRDHQRFWYASSLAFANWVLGVVEVYVVMRATGHAVTFAEAWMIEGMVQLMRAAAFVIPASVGVQEGTFVLVCRAITGDASAGVALALIRRVREIVWVSVGLLLWAWFARRRTTR